MNAPERNVGDAPAPGKWDRKAWSFRACHVVADATPGMYGWRAVTRVFRTEAEARQYLEGPPHNFAHRRVKSRALHVAVDRPNGNWGWKSLPVVRP